MTPFSTWNHWINFKDMDKEKVQKKDIADQDNKKIQYAAIPDEKVRTMMKISTVKNELKSQRLTMWQSIFRELEHRHLIITTFFGEFDFDCDESDQFTHGRYLQLCQDCLDLIEIESTREIGLDINGKPELLSTFSYIYEALGITSDEENEFKKV